MAEADAEEERRLLIRRHSIFLEDHIDSEFGLLEKLLAQAVLTKRQFDKVRATVTPQEKNELLLECVLSSGSCSRFLAALGDTNQRHIVNFLDRDGEYTAEAVGNDWPLTDNEIWTLDTNRHCLVDLIDPNDLITRLFSHGVINQRQKDLIESKLVSFEKNGCLLDILRKRSLADYEKTIACLESSNQSHVAEILRQDGVVVPVRTELEEPDPTQEEEIVNGITNTLSSLSLNASNRILGLVQLNLVAARSGRSIILYFHCLTSQDLDALNRSAVSGVLRAIIEQSFNGLQEAKERILVTVYWSNDDYRRSKSRFRDTLLTTSTSVLTPEELTCEGFFSGASVSSSWTKSFHLPK